MRFILFVAGVFHFALITAQPLHDSIDAFINRQMTEQKMVGLSIGIIENGKITKAKGYGIGNVEQMSPATEQTVYMLASVSKHMIAVGVMQLVLQGKLSLSDSCTKYFPGAPAHWNKINLRHLLNHTSGLPRESPAFKPLLIQPDSVLIKAAFNERMLFETGTKWQYCNLGYFMLADIIRQVSGKPFQQYMTEEVFGRNGLYHTEPTNAKKIIPNRAGGYVRSNGDSLHHAEVYLAFRPSGAFMSTINDMLLWEKLCQQNKILTDKSLRQMWSDTVTTTNSYPGAASVAYGYGWFRTNVSGRTIVYHGGSLPGFRTLYMRFPEEQTAIILLANTEPVDLMKIALGLADRLTGGQ